MKATILVLFVLALAVGSFSYPRTRSSRKSSYRREVKNKISESDFENLCTTIVTNEKLNDIFSDIIGLNITTLSNELALAGEKLAEIRRYRSEKLAEILSKTSFNFKLEVTKLVNKFKARFVSFILKDNVSSRQRMSTALVMKRSANTFLQRLIDLVKTPDNVKKEDVQRIFEDFLNTKITSTVRDQFDDGKILLGTYFILDEFNTEFEALIMQEEPSVGEELTNLYSDFKGTSLPIIKPVLMLLKPAILPPPETELDFSTIFRPTAQTELESITTELSADDSEDNEI